MGACAYLQAALAAWVCGWVLGTPYTFPSQDNIETHAQTTMYTHGYTLDSL